MFRLNVDQVAQYMSRATFAALLLCALEHTARAQELPSGWRYQDERLDSNLPPTPIIRPRPLLNLRQPLLAGNGAQRSGVAMLISADFDRAPAWESIRYGLGLSSDLPDAGRLHFNIYLRPNAPRPGMFWRWHEDSWLTGAADGSRLWSLGGFVDYGRAHDRARLHVTVSPQLVLNPGARPGPYGTPQLLLQYAYWHSQLDGRGDRCGRTPQAVLRWKF